MFCGETEVDFRNLEIVASVIARQEITVGQYPSATFIPLDEAAFSIESHINNLSILRAQGENIRNSSEMQESQLNTTDRTAFSLSTLIPLFLPCRTSEPRDKIYALLPLSRLSNQQYKFSSDYSISIEECYASFTKYTILETQSLDVLGMVHDSSAKTLSDLPSWVPDFSNSYVNSLPRVYNIPYINVKKVGVDLNVKWNELGIVGAVVGVVTDTAAARIPGGPNQKGDMDSSWLDMMEAIEDSRHYKMLVHTPAEVL